MKRLLTLLALAFIGQPLAALDCRHGFWIFGREHIYISHKPELGSPCHGFQVVLEVELEQDGAQEAYRALEASHGEMTMEFPQHFLLDQIKEGELVPVTATLHKGNYEDKNKPHQAILTQVPVRVVRKILYRSTTAQNSDHTVNVFLFGSARELYMINRVDQEPDFDEILQVEVANPQDIVGSQAYAVPQHRYATGKKTEAFFKEGEIGQLQVEEQSRTYEVLRKLELTTSADAFAASH